MKSNKIFYVIIGVLVAIIILLVVGIAGIIGVSLVIKGKNNNSPTVTGGNATIVTGTDGNTAGTGADGNVAGNGSDATVNGTGSGNSGENVTGNEGGKIAIDNGVTGSSETTGLVYQGFEFDIPDEFGVAFLDEIGAYIYMNDVFQLRLAIIEESKEDFEGYYDNPAVLQKKAEAAGGTITNACKVDNVQGMDIFHFRVDLEGDDCLVLRTRLNDEYSLGGNLVVLSKSVNESDFLNVFATIASTAVKTDKPDTTKEEYLGSKISGATGEALEENTISSGNASVTYKVTDGYRFKGNEADDEKVVDYYYDELFDGVWIMLQHYDGGALSYSQEHYLNKGNMKTIKNSDGREFYYNEKFETTDDYTSSRIIAATDVGNDMVFIVDLDTARKLDINDIKEFLEITIK